MKYIFKISHLTNNINIKNRILDIATKLKENMNYIEKFRMIPSIIQYINS